VGAPTNDRSDGTVRQRQCDAEIVVIGSDEEWSEERTKKKEKKKTKRSIETKRRTENKTRYCKVKCFCRTKPMVRLCRQIARKASDTILCSRF
jgi:hypothetical protein